MGTSRLKTRSLSQLLTDVYCCESYVYRNEVENKTLCPACILLVRNFRRYNFVYVHTLYVKTLPHMVFCDNCCGPLTNTQYAHKCCECRNVRINNDLNKYEIACVRKPVRIAH